ncbi:undecaprenyl-diphosphate phosphatase [Telmatospirillum siberiense]|uniref:Undecaprenyl-diphosphatase n=1 Tax=Telmatospirillum siberiense TaxID=382514 RepID=A0A2N3PP80_9PROT|nr:undecaprenyl-diphosphate phosphatase [Telmatospirillum siberiense]PKU22215.1 undecaprenyl-diphosphate phosphatase [Telmatospirillum siberiense]
MSVLLASLIAFLQGVTELFPVSSLGHAVILPAVLGLGIDQRAPEFLPFLVVLHLGTAAALLLYFWRDWLEIVFGLLSGQPDRRRESARVLTLMIIATLPAAVLGFLFEHKLKDLFGIPTIAAGFLFINGFLLFFGERLRVRHNSLNAQKGLSELTWKGALAIGFWQCTAFFPGISRSGATMVGGLLSGLSHRASAHFSFLIATPVILGAAILEVPKLLHHTAPAGMLTVSLIGGAVAGVTAFASIAFLMHYFRKHDFEALNPFAFYCWLAGGGSLLFLWFA